MAANCAAYEGRVVAIAQMGLDDGMPLWYDYEVNVIPTPPNKLGGLMRKGFNRGVYWGSGPGSGVKPTVQGNIWMPKC